MEGGSAAAFNRRAIAWICGLSLLWEFVGRGLLFAFMGERVKLPSILGELEMVLRILTDFGILPF